MNWKDFASDYLSFNRKERIALLFVAGVMVLIILLPDFVKKSPSRENIPIDTMWFSAVRKLERKTPDSGWGENNGYDEGNSLDYQYDRRSNSYVDDGKLTGELFYFDPNSTLPSEWKRLGLRDKTVQTIQNYLSKGGKFRKPEDLQRIYGLHKDEYERLLPYIRIEQGFENKPNEISETAPSEKPGSRNYSSRYSAIDVNTADTAAFISLPGIGSRLAARIINFRDKLGGFYSVEQVKETYGLPDSTYEKIKPYLKLDNALVKKININTATIDELKAHPYIRYTVANSLVAYRKEHGPFARVEDIKRVMAVTEEVFNKINSYLTTQ
jgi:competence ComEA-like helix-hairpin-helix protein